jgi:hypothetical protein
MAHALTAAQFGVLSRYLRFEASIEEVGLIHREDLEVALMRTRQHLEVGLQYLQDQRMSEYDLVECVTMLVLNHGYDWDGGHEDASVKWLSNISFDLMLIVDYSPS